MENFNAINGLKMTHIPYKSASPVMTDLLSGEIHVYCPAVPQLPPFLKSGKIRALGVTYLEPTKLLPDVPPVADTVSGFALYGWYGMHAPRKTPPALVRKINAELVKALKDPKLAKIMLAAGGKRWVRRPRTTRRGSGKIPITGPGCSNKAAPSSAAHSSDHKAG
jgi:tripartite-type tricarboxylate transporter receptor subunit TctC